MTLLAKTDPTSIKLDGDGALAYNSGSPTARQHDSCFYLIKPDPEAGADAKYLNVEIVNIDQANAYLYGG